ncbi:MAG: ABC transporter ATP-binding protein [Lentisphaerae bacterium]|nr:ABC transporter ATP-binding protein [Lentisphaerota bacterium]
MSTPRKIRQDRSALTVVQHKQRESERRPLDFDLIRRLFRFSEPYRKTRTLLLVLVLTRTVQLPLLAWAIGAVLSGPVSRLDLRGIILGTLGYLLLAIMTQGTFIFRSLFALRMGEHVLHDLRRDMFGHLQRQPIQFFVDTPIGRMISRFTNDAEGVRAGVQDVLFVTLVQTGQMLIAAAVMCYYDWALFMMLLALGPFLFGMNYYFRRRLSRIHRTLQESFSRVTATLAESVSGIRVTQGFSRERRNADLFSELVADHATFNQDLARASGVFLPLLEINNQLFLAGLLLVGGWRVLHGSTGVENLYQFVMMSGAFFQPMVSIGNIYNQALASMAGAERVFQFLDTPPAWQDRPEARPHTLQGRVEFRHVHFAYRPETPVLHDISFTAEPGQTIALIGHSGSGKTTIANLIAKFYLPTRGELLLDGQEIRLVQSDSLHQQISMVLQQNFLFSGTVIENIRLGRPAATDHDVREALQRLDCFDALDSLPEGLQTVVGERGAGISLGQRQVICFARAMLANPRILILDEATSSIDTITELRIQHALEVLLAGRTSFVVAHRLSTIRHADLLLVLDRGRIIERGTHTELLAVGGAYASLYRQFVRAGQIRE